MAASYPTSERPAAAAPGGPSRAAPRTPGCRGPSGPRCLCSPSGPPRCDGTARSGPSAGHPHCGESSTWWGRERLSGPGPQRPDPRTNTGPLGPSGPGPDPQDSQDQDQTLRTLRTRTRPPGPDPQDQDQNLRTPRTRTRPPASGPDPKDQDQTLRTRTRPLGLLGPGGCV